MKTKFRGMTLAAMLLSASTVASGEQDDVTYDGDGFVTPVAYVGDVSSHEEDAYFAEDASYAMRANEAAASAKADAVQAASHSIQQNPHVAQARQPAVPQPAPAQPAVRQQAPRQYAPVAASQLQPVGYDMGGGSIYSSPVAGYYDGDCNGDCNGGCDGGCDSLGGGKSCCFGGLTDLMGCSGSPGWARAELLLWFTEDRNSPPLVIVGPGNTDDFQGASNAFGDPLESAFSAGFRGDYGMYLSDDFGIGGRFWILGESSDDFSVSGDGRDRTIGRPFFDTSVNDPNAALIVAANGTFQGTTRDDFGTFHAESKLDILAAEAYGRINLVSNSCCRLDMIGGYSHFSVDDSLRVWSSTTRAINPNQGRTTEFFDALETENRFHGGHYGFESFMQKGNWTARSLAKVHLGNMDQTVQLYGSRVDTIPGGPVTPANAGFYVLGGESGTYENDEFSFVPELNFKLGYKFRSHVEFNVGYTFMFFDNVALAGEQANPNINILDLAAINPPPSNRIVQVKDSSLWVQGIDLGVTVTY